MVIPLKEQVVGSSPTGPTENPVLGIEQFSANLPRGDRLMAGRLTIRPQPLACYRAEGGWLSGIRLCRFDSCKPRLNAGPVGVGYR